VAERKVVFHRIGGIELPELRRDLFRGRPTRRSAAGQPQVPADAVNVRVDRNDQLRGRHGPKTEIDTVGGPNHPSRVEDEPLAGAPGTRVADQVPGRPVRGAASKLIGEPCEALSKIPVRRPVMRGKRVPDRTVLANQQAGAREHGG